MAGRHRSRNKSIQIIRTASVPVKDCKRLNVTQFHVSSHLLTFDALISYFFFFTIRCNWIVQFVKQIILFIELEDQVPFATSYLEACYEAVEICLLCEETYHFLQVDVALVLCFTKDG